jgi:SAM-dependent methyltransferase
MSVERHYNNLASGTVSKRQRRDLRTFPVRDYNNSLKRHVLSVMAQRLPPRPRIIDLCCGRGGDIFKYNDLNPSEVVFVDISQQSIAEAKRRYKRGKKDIKYEASFVVADCFSPSLRDVVPGTNQFDLVICHFALHYGFDRRERVQEFFTSVKSYIGPVGFFICTVPSYRAISSRATDCQPDPKTQWQNFGNPVYKVEFNPAKPLRTQDANNFGLEYLFTLEDAVDRCPEYLVPTNLLNYYLSTHGLTRIIDQGFLEYATAWNILDKYPTQAMFSEVCSLYQVVCVENTQPVTNWVGVLQEFTQKHCYERPQYFLQGEADNWTASVSVNVLGSIVRQHAGPCTTKKAARQGAAAKLYSQYFLADKPSAQTPPAELLAMCSPTSLIQDISAADLTVHVDADHISFVTHQVTRLYRSVYFIFYCGHGAELSHLKHFEASDTNTEIRRGRLPMKNLADSMILTSVATLNHILPKGPQLVVSRDATVFHAEVLFPQTTQCVATQARFKEIMNGKDSDAVRTADTFAKHAKIWK